MSAENAGGAVVLQPQLRPVYGAGASSESSSRRTAPSQVDGGGQMAVPFTVSERVGAAADELCLRPVRAAL